MEAPGPGPPDEEAFRALLAKPLLLQTPLQARAWDGSPRRPVLGPQTAAAASPPAHRPPRRPPHRPIQQAVLELLFSQLRAQGSAITDLQGRLEAHQAAAAAERAAGQARLLGLEARLAGTSNLAGRQAALDEIASIIGVSVADQEVRRAAQGLMAVAVVREKKVPA